MKMDEKNEIQCVFSIYKNGWTSMKMDQIDQMDQKHKRKCLLADHCGLSIRDYWQTVQKIFMGTSALPQSFEKCSNSCTFVQSIRGLPTRRNCQNEYIFCKRSANNL